MDRRKIETAVRAMQIYCGAVDHTSVRSQERFYKAANKAVERVARDTGLPFYEAHRQISAEAERRGCIKPIPGKDY